MAYLFDTDAVSETLRKKPAPAYLMWLGRVPRADQFTSAIVIGELYRGAFRAPEPARHLVNIEERILAALTVLPFDAATARVYGEIQAHLAAAGQGLADADLQIAATAIRHNLSLVTGNLRHFARIPGLRLEQVLAEARRGGG
jgi:predicted nucleic acid-binding protein